MKTEIITQNGVSTAVVHSDEILISDTGSALDFMSTVKYETKCDRVALNKEAVSEDFFILSTRLAGEVLQKFINYYFKFAVYGDFSHYTSKPLKDFIYESNNGRDVFFTATAEEAAQRLCNAK